MTRVFVTTSYTNLNYEELENLKKNVIERLDETLDDLYSVIWSVSISDHSMYSLSNALRETDIAIFVGDYKDSWITQEEHNACETFGVETRYCDIF